jgi:hypothetical protein
MVAVLLVVVHEGKIQMIKDRHPIQIIHFLFVVEFCFIVCLVFRQTMNGVKHHQYLMLGIFNLVFEDHLFCLIVQYTL